MPYISPHDQNSSSILYLTNTAQELMDLKMRLLGKEPDDKGDYHVVSKPLCKEEGASKIVGLVSGLANKHGILTHQEEDRISRLMLSFSKTIRYSLMLRRVEWNIDYGDRDMILEMAADLAYVALQRGFKGGDRRFWKGTQQEVRQTVHHENAKKGLLGKMWG